MGGERNQVMIPPNPPWKGGSKSEPVHDSLRPAIYDQPDYYSEWMLSAEDEDEENTAQSPAELLKVIKRYQEL